MSDSGSSSISFTINNMKNNQNLTLNIKNSNNMDIGAEVITTLKTAFANDRITCGVYECGKVLEGDPRGVMLCILSHNVSREVSLKIHFTLIEAYCWGNNIQLLRVDSNEKLSEIILGEVCSYDNEGLVCQNLRRHLGPSDFNCVLIEYPPDGSDLSEAEANVIRYCQSTSEIGPAPVVELPI